MPTTCQSVSRPLSFSLSWLPSLTSGSSFKNMVLTTIAFSSSGRSQRPSTTRGRIRALAGRDPAHLQRIALGVVGPHPAAVVEAPPFGRGDARHAERLSLDLVDPVRIPENEERIVVGVLEHIVEGVQQRVAHAEHADEDRAAQDQGRQGQRQPTSAAEGVAQREQGRAVRTGGETATGRPLPVGSGARQARSRSWPRAA